MKKTFFIFLLLLLATPLASAQSVSIGDYSAVSDSVITVPITISDAESIAGGVINISFNSSIVTIKDVVAGDFGTPVANVNNTDGWVKLVAASVENVNKSEAVLANLVFNVSSVGTSDLRIVYISLNNESGGLITPVILNGSITANSDYIPRTITVNSSGGADYTTIQAAINASEPGDTIEVYSGTYYENVVVNKQLVLRGIGTGGGIPEIDARRFGSALNITADGCVLNGFYVVNASWGHWPDYDAGLKLSSYNNIISNINASNNAGHGIFLQHSNNTILENNYAVNNGYYGINVEYSHNISLIDNTASFNNNGIYLSNSNDSNLQGNIASDNSNYMESYGIRLDNSNNNTLRANIAMNNTGSGYPGYGIYLSSSKNNVLIDNSASYNGGSYSYSGGGIYIGWNSNSNIVKNNSAYSNINSGIVLSGSSNNTLQSNLMYGNNFNFELSGWDDSHFYNNIDTNNLVDSKSIYYILNISGTVINSFSNAGTVYCINCENVTVKDLTLSNNGNGIYFYNTSNSKIQNNWLRNNGYGIYLGSSSNDNAITGNNASNNDWYGVSLGSSNNNTVVGNIASNNNYGIQFSSSSNNSVTGNNVNSNNYHGIYLTYSNNNILYQNNLVNNTNYNAYDYNGNNQWDGGTTGNYYSDYTSTDSNGDGIGDTPYNISGSAGAQDRYPFMKENGWLENIRPPASITDLQNITYAQASINWIWTNPDDIDFSHVMVYLDGIFQTNVTLPINYYNATNLTAGVEYTISTHTVDLSGNINQTWINHTARTAPLSDTTPPSSVTDLQNITRTQISINWTWQNPSDFDFNHTVVYIDGLWKINTSKNYYNLTGLLPNTTHTISTRTVDINGNINLTWVNDTVTTLPVPDAVLPIITITSPVNDTFYNIDSVNLNYSVNEPTAWQGYSLDTGTSIILYGNTTLTSLLDGLHTLTVYANDTSGNMNSSMVCFMIDTTPPSIISVTLNDTLVKFGAPIEVTVNATDENGIDTVTADGIPLALIGGYYIGTITADTSPVTVNVTDEVGNMATDTSATYNIDDTEPVINTVTLNITTPKIGEDILVTVNATDNFAVTSVEANDIALVHQLGNNWTGSITAIEGIHPVNISGRDAVGNVGWDNSTSYTATMLDTIPPASITNLSPTAGESWINWTWTNPSDPDFNHTIIYMDGSFAANVSEKYYNATGLLQGTLHTISTRTVDLSGNVNETWVSDTAMTAGELPGGLSIKISKPSSYSFYPVGETVEFNAAVTDQVGNPVTSGISAYADLSGPDSASRRVILSGDAGNFVGEYTVKGDDARGIWTVNINAFNATSSGQASLQLFFTGAYFIQPYTDSRSYLLGETANFTAKVVKPVGSSQLLTDKNLSLNLLVYLFNTTTLVSGPVEMVFDDTTGKFHGDVNTGLLGSGLFSVVFSGNDTDGNIETESLTIGVSEDFNIVVGTDQTYYDRNEPVNIHGLMEFIDGTPLSNTDVNLRISLKGFMRSYTATTNETGGFNYTFQPFAAEAGNYTITSTAVNLGLQRTAESHFTIHGLYLAPPSGTLNMVENSTQDIDFILYNLGETTLTGITATVNDLDTSDNVDATIVTTVPNELQPSESTYITLNVSAGTPVPENAAFFITVSTDQMSDETSELDVNLFSPNPVVVLEPDNIAVGLNQNQTALKTVTISNTGYGVLRNLTLTQPDYNWMRISSNTTIGDLKPGENTSFDIHIHSYNVSLGTYHDTVGITSDNHESMVVDLSASITDQTYGGLLFYVENELGQNISGASISLIDDILYQEYTAITNSTGYALINDLPTGRYIYEVSSSGDNTLSQLNSVVVEPMEQSQRVNVTMPLSFIDFEWDVIPSTIDDWYQIVLNMTFETDVPVPIIVAFPPHLEYNMNPGDVQSGTLTVANLGLVSLFDVSITPYINNNVQFTPIVSHIEELKAKSSVQIPYTIELAPNASSCDGFTGKISIKGKYIHFINSEGVASYTGTTVPLIINTPTCEPPEIGTGTIIGTVTDASDGSQIDNARVVAGRYYNDTDSAGSYTLTDVKPRTYTITAYKDGYYPISKTVVVTKDTTETVNFQLTPITTGPITGIVTNAIDGTPIEGARVAAGGRSDATDDSGSYTLSGVLTGSHTITASKRGFYTSSTTVLVTEDNTAVVNFQLTPIPETVYGSISGMVSDIDGEPLPFALVVTNGGFDFTDESGSYTITGVPVGNNSVIASKAWYHSVSKTVQVYEDCTTIVNFQLKKIIIPPVPIPDCECISGTPPVIWVYKGPDFGWLTPPPTTPSKMLVENCNDEGTIEFSDAYAVTISLNSLWIPSLSVNIGTILSSVYNIPVGDIWHNEFIPKQIDPNEETMLDVENMSRFFSDMESFGITLPIPDIFAGALGFVYGPYPHDASHDCLKIIPLGGMEIKNGSINIVFPPGPGPGPGPGPDTIPGPDPVPPVFTKTIHEIVQLSISQNATMERDAFWAGLGIRNRMPDTNIDNVRVSLHISDENGSANDKFFIRAPRLEDISDIGGSGTISPLQLAKAQWLIIPKPGAGGVSGQTYNISADIAYSVNGTNFRVTTENVGILVNPQPQLILDYYLPSDVIGNSPFKLAVMVTNDGYGTAKNFSIETAQPVIYNPSGLMIDFEIIRSALQGEERSDSLKINFGDLGPGESKLAWWEMVVSMDGTFTNFTGEYTHSSELGGMETSLIKQLNTNIIHREIETEAVNYSFLVTPKDDETHYLLLDSDSGGSTPVSIANYTIVSGPTPDNPNLDISIENLTGQWVIVSIEDPYDNKVPILKVIRDSDSSEIPFYNCWMRDGRILIVDHYTEGFDGNYTIIFKYSNVVPVITTDRTMFDGRIVVEENKAINFSGSDSYDEFGSIVSYKWEFGDGSPIELGENISHRYSQMGEYGVILNVTNNAGVSSQTSVKVLVVKQIVEGLVLLSDFSDKLWNLQMATIYENERKVTNYYLDVSYQSNYINFTTYPSIIHINKKISDYNKNPIQYHIINDTLNKLPNKYVNEDFVLVVATDYGKREMAFPCITDNEPNCNYPYSIAVVKSDSSDIYYRIWSHEIGHTLGRKLISSKRYNDYDLLWDLYTDGCIKMLNGKQLLNDGRVSGEWDIMGGKPDNAPPPHLSSMSKVLLGWMKTKEVSLYDTINVRAIEQGNYGDQAFIYRSVLYNNVQYVIEARDNPRNEVVIYKLEDYDLMNDVATPTNNRHTVSINNIGHLDLGWNFVWFYVSEESENPYSAKVKIAHPSLYNNMAGWVVSTTKPISNNIQSWWALNESNLTDPDIDLHAYSLDGKHIGVNYSNGLYENEIQGAFSSGDLINGEEWIFVPSDINVSYYIGSHDVQKFLEENPDFNASNATIEFDATYMEYSPNTKHVQLPDGNWTISNRSVSDTQVETINPGEMKEIILKDKTPPNIITELTAINGTSWINFTWTNPSDPDFNHTEIYLNGTFITNIPAPQNYYNATGLLPDTSYELSTRTVDAAGNINETWVNGTAHTLSVSDDTPPTITFISPTDPSGTTLTTRNWTFINISLSEPGLSWLEWNGINESMPGSGTYWYINKTGLDNGVYTYRVWANDSAGNVNVSETRAIEIDCDTLPPVITITSPLNDTTYNTDSVDLNYSVNEPTAWQGYSLDGSANITLYGNTTLTGLTDGLHTLTIYANDTFRNMNSSTVWFTIDTTPPVGITDLQHTAGQTWLNFTWTNPPDSDFNYTEIYLYGTFITNIPAPQNYYNITGLLLDTSYELSTRTVDTSGNINETWVNATARTLPLPDTTPPIITFSPPTDPNDTTLTARNWTFINISLSEPGFSWLEWNSINESMSGSGTHWYINKTGLDNGLYTYRVWANDSAGNVNVSETRAIEIDYDTLPPVITITSPVNDTTYNIDSVDLNYSVNEPTAWQGYSLNGAANITLQENTTLTDLTDGEHTLTVYANDTSGNINSSTIWFTIDTIPPAGITDLQYTAGQTWINWTWLNPSDPNFNHTKIYLNGTFLTNIPAPQNYYNATGLLPDTSYELSTRTVDTFGNINETWVNATACTLSLPDTTPPVITFTPPTDPNDTTLTTRSWTFINVSLSEPGFSWLEWNGTNESMSGSGTHWYINRTGLDNGVYTYRVWANDSAGNVNVSETRAIEIDCDTLPPIVTITSPVNDTTYNTDSVDLNYSVNEPVVWQAYSLDSAANITFHENTTLTDLTDGLHTLTIYANDTSGNMNSSTVWFTIDTTPPVGITDLQHTAGQTWINWTWTNPPDPDFNHTEIYLNGTFQTNTSAEHYNAIGLAPGTEYTLGTRTEDINGNINLTWVNDTATTLPEPDTLPPVITITSPVDDTTYNIDSVDLNYSANEPTAWQGYSLDGSANITLNENTTLTDLTDGGHILTVYANDTFGNMNSTTVWFTVDTAPPEGISDLQHTAGQTWLNWTWTNPHDPDFNHTEIYLNSTFLTNIPAPQNYYNATGLLPDTSYELGTHTVDTFGSINETWVNDTARTLSIPDDTPPAITFILPTDPSGTILTTRNWTFINVSLSEPGLSWLEWNSINESMAGSDTNWYINKTDLVNGVYTYRVWANDTAGNENSSETRTIEINYVTDNPPPIISITSPMNDTLYTTDSVELNYTVNEPTIWEGYSLDGADNITLSGNTTLFGLNDGSHILTIYANDTSGNMNSSTVQFAVYTSPPYSSANITFVITDNEKKEPIKLATVSLHNRKVKTNETGIAVFTNVEFDEYKYSVRMNGYKRLSGKINVNEDTTYKIELMPKKSQLTSSLLFIFLKHQFNTVNLIALK